MDEKTAAEWRRLCDAAIHFRNLAPWNWMTEVDIFGVQFPDSEEIGFCSILGELGEHLGMSVYLGPEALYDCLRMSADIEDAILIREQLYCRDTLHVSFESKRFTEAKDRELLRALGYRIQGANSRPVFRRFGQARAPRNPTLEETRWLAVALEQACVVAEELGDADYPLLPPERSKFLVRTPVREDGELVWKDRIRTIPPPRITLPFRVSRKLLASVEQLPHVDSRLEVVMNMLPTTVSPPDGQVEQHFLFGLLVVDADTGSMVGAEVLEPLPTLNEMWGRVPNTLLTFFRDAGTLPASMAANQPKMRAVLKRLARLIPFEVISRKRLPAAENSRAWLMDYMLERQS